MTNATSALTTASTSYWDAQEALGAIATSVAAWTGLAADAWREANTALAADLTASRDRILEGKSAISAYHSTTLSISNRAATAKGALADALDVYTVAQPNQLTDPEGFERWQNNRYMAQYQAQDARDEIYRLALERAAADDDAIRALSAALPDNWTDTVAALASVGITGVGDLTRGLNKEALLELAQRIAAGGADPADYDALALMLGMYENNESVMSDFYLALGGEDTVNLIEAIGDWGANDPSVAAAALALAVLTRSGLSTGSRNWTQPVADEFADSMFDVGQDKGDSIAYLFSDVVDSPLGLTLAIAAANEIDEFERVNGFQWLMDETGGGLWLGLQEFGNDGNRMSDASGPIFSTLGQYPDAAFEWLTDGGTGDDRVDYWYHDRYDNMYWLDQNNADIPWYITHDGFQGVADLWFGSQQASGGPVNGGDGAATPEDVAILDGRIMRALITSELFLPENISDAASASLAAGFVVNIAGLTEYTIMGNGPQGLLSGATQLENGEWVPVLTEKELAVFLARSGSHESGAAVLSFGVSSYQETLLNMAMSSGNTADIDRALDRMVALQAAVEAATQGQLIENAEGSDADREAAVSAITLVLGAVPVPMLGDAVGGAAGFVLSWAQGVATGAVLDMGSTAVSDLWASQTEQALAQFDENREGTLQDSIRTTIAQSIYQYFSEVDPSYIAGIDPPSGDLLDWYNSDGTGAALQDALEAWTNSGQPDSAFDDNIIDTLAQQYDDKLGNWADHVVKYDGVVKYEDQW